MPTPTSRLAPPALLLLAALGAAACASGAPGAPPASTRVVLQDTAGRPVGALFVITTAGGVRVTGALEGVAPGGHGLHFHAAGRCDAPTFESAGGHHNPSARAHGFENPAGPHAGDLRNVTVGEDGRALVALESSMSPASRDALFDADGSALVLHAGADDYRTDPSGGSGARVACGVVAGSR